MAVDVTTDGTATPAGATVTEPGESAQPAAASPGAGATVAEPAESAHPAAASPAVAAAVPSRAVTAIIGVAAAVLLVGGVAAAMPVAERQRAETAEAEAASAFAASPPPVPDSTSIHGQPEVALPVRVDIPKIGVSAPVDELGTQKNGEMAVPADFARTGWFNGVERPGQVGSSVIVGHYDSHTGPAVFFKLPQLSPGDEVLVARADGSTVRFVVERIEQYKKRDFPTIAVYAPTGRPTLRLITCGGTFDKKQRHYRDNVVVYASAEEAV